MLTVVVYISGLTTKIYINSIYKKIKSKDYGDSSIPVEFLDLKEHILDISKSEYVAKAAKFVSHDLKYPYNMLENVIEQIEMRRISLDNIHKVFYPIKKSIRAGKTLIQIIMDFSNNQRTIKNSINSINEMIYQGIVSASVMMHKHNISRFR